MGSSINGRFDRSIHIARRVSQQEVLWRDGSDLRDRVQEVTLDFVHPLELVGPRVCTFTFDAFNLLVSQLFVRQRIEALRCLPSLNSPDGLIQNTPELLVQIERRRFFVRLLGRCVY